MTEENFQNLINDIVVAAVKLKDKYTDQQDTPVNYACVFCQSNKEYEDLIQLVGSFGRVLLDTNTGPLFQIEPIETEAGPLQIVKIRKFDPAWPERGDADFKAKDYNALKEKYLPQPGFKLIPRETFEMIELMKPGANVRVYFSNPPVEEQYGLK